MKKLITTLVFSLTVVVMFAQTNEAPKRLKYVTQAPDGSVAMTIYDDSRDDTMKLKSASTFNKYQIIDSKRDEPIHSARNNGKECTIHKANVAAGTYDIRLYTKKFVITSKITVSTSQHVGSEAVASND